MVKREQLDPYWHKARIASRIWMKAVQGRPLTAREKRVAKIFANEKGVSNRLIQQGVLGALGGPYRMVQTRSGTKQSLYLLDDPQELADVLGRRD
ncbi:MAG: hypothetical protein QOE70_6172 [Chthoniobacter sp.]|jgi:muconolactone delta-isomerase|nr:hypothetical protein [Chthoniobacter sp.]